MISPQPVRCAPKGRRCSQLETSDAAGAGTQSKKNGPPSNRACSWALYIFSLLCLWHISYGYVLCLMTYLMSYVLYVLCISSYISCLMSYMSYVYLLMICLSCLMTYILCLMSCVSRLVITFCVSCARGVDLWVACIGWLDLHTWRRISKNQNLLCIY